MNLTLTERYLADFHDANAGATSRAFEHLAVVRGTQPFASTYHALGSILRARDAPRALLDLACGDGHLLALLADNAPHATLIGIDLSQGELAAARSRLGPRAALVRARAQQLPLASASVDAVLSHLALMLMDDAERVVAEVRRVCRSGAVFAGVVGARSPPSPAREAFIRLYAGASKRPQLADIRFGDRRFRSAEGIRELLTPAFDAFALEELNAARDCTPVQLWAWFLDMYDTDLLMRDALASFRSDCLLAWQSLCGPAGTLRHEDRYLQFSARAAT